MSEPGLDEAVASSCNKLHLYFQLRPRKVAMPIILHRTIFNLRLNMKYRTSVFGHELWHFVGSSNTKVKKELMLQAIKRELDTKPDSLFIEDYDNSLVPLWEAVAYQSQLSRDSTPKELAEVILSTLKADSKQYDLTMLVDSFVRNVSNRLAKTNDMTGDILSGHILQDIDVLHRLGLDFSVISEALKKLLAASEDEIPPLKSMQDMTAFASGYLFKSIPVQASDDYVVAQDIVDRQKTFNLPIKKAAPSYLMDYEFQDLTYWKELRDFFLQDTDQKLKKYALSVLDDFGVATPLFLCTVNSLEGIEQIDPKNMTVHFPDPSAMLLRLGERINLANRYFKDWKGRLEKSGLLDDYKRYLIFLNSMRDARELLAATQRDVAQCQERTYEFLMNRFRAED